MALELSTKIPEVKDVIKQVCELSADEKLRREIIFKNTIFLFLAIRHSLQTVFFDN